MKRLAALCCAISVSIAPMAVAAPTISHVPASCVPAGGNTKLVATGEGLASARVFFKAEGAATEYYVEMLQGPDGFWAVLPAPNPGVNAVSYRIVGRDANGAEKVVEGGSVPVSAACASFSLTPDEQRIANNLVIGQTTHTISLHGFSCEGVANTITLSGEMRPFNECDDNNAIPVLLAGSGPLVNTGLAKTVAIIGVGAAAGSIAVVAIDNQGDDRDPVSPILP